MSKTIKTIKTLSIDSTLSAIRSASPEARGKFVGDIITQGKTLQEALNKAIAAQSGKYPLDKDKGTRVVPKTKDDKFLSTVDATLSAAKNGKEARFSEASVKQIISRIRQCLIHGREFSFNPSRKSGGKTGARTGGKPTTQTTPTSAANQVVRLTYTATSTERDIASGLYDIASKDAMLKDAAPRLAAWLKESLAAFLGSVDIGESDTE